MINIGNVGRPIKITAEEIKKKINDYFSYCTENNKPMTMSGLAFFLDMSRTTLFNYETQVTEFKNVDDKEKEEILNAIKRAKRMVQMYAEETLYTARNPAGIIFSLKNNFNWKDIQEVNNNISANNPLENLSLEELQELKKLADSN